MTEELLANAYIKGASDLLQGKIEGMPKIVIIPKGATNGDMIKAMFPNAWKSNYIDIDNQCTLYIDDYELEVDIDWWNTPYKVRED